MSVNSFSGKGTSLASEAASNSQAYGMAVNRYWEMLSLVPFSAGGVVRRSQAAVDMLPPHALPATKKLRQMNQLISARALTFELSQNDPSSCETYRAGYETRRVVMA